MNNFRKLSVHDLEILSELPKMTSIRSFAQNLDMTPSFLSKKIQKLESVLGMKLIHRTSRGVNVTKDAEDAILIAREIIEKVHEIRSPEGQSKQSKIPNLTIGTRGFLNTALAPSILSHFQKINIPIHFRFIDMSPTDQMNSALNDSVDVLIGLRKVNFGENWQTRSIGDLTWSVFAKRGHPLTASSTVNIEQALIYPFTRPIYWDGTSVLTIPDSIPIPGKIFKYGHGVQNTETAISVIAETNHLTYLPKLAARKSIERMEVSEIYIKDFPPKNDPVYLSIHTGRVMKSVYQELKYILEQNM